MPTTDEDVRERRARARASERAPTSRARAPRLDVAVSPQGKNFNKAMLLELTFEYLGLELDG